MVNQKTEADYHILARKRGFKWAGSHISRIIDTTGWECNEGHRWRTAYANILRGTGCPHCFGNARKIEADYSALARSRGYEWIDMVSPPNVYVHTVWRCDKGHQWEASYKSLKESKHGCPHCAGKLPKTPEDYHALAKLHGLEWLGPQVPSVVTKTKWKCARGHEWVASYHNVDNSRMCFYCNEAQRPERTRAMWAAGVFDNVFKSPTSIELDIAAALNNFGIEHTSQFRPDNHSCPYDEFIPPNILIEIHGDFWHANPLFYATTELYAAQEKSRHRDVKKKNWAIEHGYHLITFWENEINEHGAEHLVKERILPLLGEGEERCLKKN